MIFANTDKEITIIYHSEDHLGRQILAYAHTENFPIHDIDLAHVKITSLQWIELTRRLKIEIKDLINTESTDFLQKFKKSSDLSDEDWLTLLIQNPTILKAPIVMKGDKIVMMSNSQDMLHFL